MFANLRIDGYNLVPVPWVPHEEADTLSSYAMKMASSIPEANPMILGLSFGGMLTVEIAKNMPVSAALLVSSAKTGTESGYRQKILQNALTFIPEFLFVNPHPVQLYHLGAKTSEEKDLLRKVISQADPKFVKWAVGALLHWNNTEYPPSIYHIHGTNDKVIYPDKIKPNVWITDGSHIMIYNRAVEVSIVIRAYLDSR